MDETEAIGKISALLFKEKRYEEWAFLNRILYKSAKTNYDRYTYLGYEYIAMEKLNDLHRGRVVLQKIVRMAPLGKRYFCEGYFIKLSQIEYAAGKKKTALKILNEGILLSYKYKDGELDLLETLFGLFGEKELKSRMLLYEKVIKQVIRNWNLSIPEPRGILLTYENIKKLRQEAFDCYCQMNKALSKANICIKKNEIQKAIKLIEEYQKDYSVPCLNRYLVNLKKSWSKS